MKTVYSALALCAVIVLGCAAAHKISRSENIDRRIVYRDLTKPLPATYPVPSAPGAPTPAPQAPRGKTIGYRPERFVEFANESAREFDEQALAQFARATPGDALVLVVGHSHGDSAAGTLNLAAARAQTVLRNLVDKGFTNVHLMAAWGGRELWFAPSRGVHLYVLDGAAKDQLPIVFAKQVEEKTHDGDSVPGPLADPRPAAARLGHV